MADQYGPLVLPPPAYSAPTFPPVQAAGDPLLGFLGDFLKSVMVAYGAALLGSPGLLPNRPVVSKVVLDDPDRECFSVADLPALYVYREDKPANNEEWEEADDYRFARCNVVARWVPTAADFEQRRILHTAMNALAKIVDNAVERGRDPAWVVPGDDAPPEAAVPGDPKTPGNGSSIAKYLGFHSLFMKHWGRTMYRVPRNFRQQPAPARGYFDELTMIFELVEELNLDISIRGGEAQGSGQIVSPDQGTGLGNLDLGLAIFK